nr:LuxR C-terminal-related transcriptional regulator [Mycobacterium sp. AT1]
MDRADNDPTQFWTYLITALQQAVEVMSTRVSDLLEMGADITEVVLPTLLNEIQSHRDVVVLVLDDYHLVTKQVIHKQMTFLVEMMPTNLRLVLATRSDPTLPLGRLRAAAELHEVRSADLRLAPEEVTGVLNDILGLELSDNEISLLGERTEGWVAGLHLVGLSLAAHTNRHAFVAEFVSDNRHVVDYLSSEVLAGQSEAVRNFLLHTSILTHLNGPLCDALLDTTGSESLLYQIELDNLFLIPLDSSRGWYRYHHLFADMLYKELRRTSPTVIEVLHRRAAAWYSTAGLPDETVRHLIAAGDEATAAELVASVWAAEFNVGRLTTVSSLLDRLPRDVVAADPRLCVARAWIALDSGRHDEAEAWIDTAVHSVTDIGFIPAELVVLRAVCRFKVGDLGQTLVLARQAVDMDLSDVRIGPSAAYCIYGSGLYWSGDTHGAQIAYQRAARLAAKANNHLGRAYALGYLAVIAAQHGRLDQADLLVEQITRDLTEDAHFVDMMTSLAKAKIFDRRHDRVAAADAATMAVALARRGGGVIEIAHALVTQSEILGHLGDTAAAQTALTEAAQVLAGAVDPGPAREILAIAAKASNRSREPTNRRHSQEQLSAQELAVLHLMRLPLSRAEIGRRLFISVNTVKSHQRALYRKLGASDRAAALGCARQRGIL